MERGERGRGRYHRGPARLRHWKHWSPNITTAQDGLSRRGQGVVGVANRDRPQALCGLWRRGCGGRNGNSGVGEIGLGVRNLRLRCTDPREERQEVCQEGLGLPPLDLPRAASSNSSALLTSASLSSDGWSEAGDSASLRTSSSAAEALSNTSSYLPHVEEERVVGRGVEHSLRQGVRGEYESLHPDWTACL